MARSGFWLRGAQGKLAGASMSKGANGETIYGPLVRGIYRRTADDGSLPVADLRGAKGHDVRRGRQRAAERPSGQPLLAEG